MAIEKQGREAAPAGRIRPKTRSMLTAVMARHEQTPNDADRPQLRRVHIPNRHRKTLGAIASSLLLLGLGVVLRNTAGWVAALIGVAGLAAAGVIGVLERRDAPPWSKTLGGALALGVLTALGVGLGAGLLIGNGKMKTATPPGAASAASHSLATSNQSGGTNINGDVNVQAKPHPTAELTVLERDKPLHGGKFEASAWSEGFDREDATGYVTNGTLVLKPDGGAVENFIVVMSGTSTEQAENLWQGVAEVQYPMSYSLDGVQAFGMKNPSGNRWKLSVLTAKPAPHMRLRALVNVEERSPKVCSL